ncbi:uncharacterized protein LOC5576540 isoform X1 [Aedes aegypti]|uniref:BZIP domain-containing protein n=1 Tax=Aedes aegypti TaxID=7159 RepID=A0A6I8TM09_AEDAE|nr:uncharacterized protein LOC5576540 isoform X1 [Aedes aegypti]XP_021694783.1 uncharacterized protein LOC5576540 isoform X1 [Aedes aegypti]XP_021694784.1 uncharacterized protein LOC5576540 isoform X1 [Aedes aegypti]XP_021694785.1 uncharacterized protein LOC5576540 isoform X1 [Aedes aegypti]XP_021694786.1 uncharacterized protein LOC5576540 isoform X1 [Aedes aegypti]XP_021694787.1 uncharacterized protein LOC5576540 isoform X1 [Aedes aegypti]XP_021694788.1 uncharacterized protein LOC5576540 iso
MASSLNRIFTRKISSASYEMDQEDDFCGFSSGSETETISERDSGEDDESSISERRNKRGGVAPGKANGKLERNPTRRPNPKISNRNALLARENRRRKKEHVESLERELEELKDCNGKIRKALKKKSKLVQELTRERNYLKSVIANRTGIMAVLKSVQRAGFPMTSSGLSYVTEPMGGKPQRIGSSSDEGLGSSPHSALTDEEDKFNPHDLGLSALSGQEVSSFEEEFSRLPDVDELLSTMAGGDRSRGEQVITTEHNYFEHSNHNSLESGSASGSGVCVHIVPGGRVSVEFCASCALSSQRAWLEEAEER